MTTRQADIAAIRAEIREAARMLMARDVDGLAATYAPDAVGTFISGPEIRITGAGKIREHFAALSPVGKIAKSEILDEVIDVSGDLGYDALLWRIEFEYEDRAETTTLECAATVVFKRGSDGQWKCVVDHTSVKEPVLRK